MAEMAGVYRDIPLYRDRGREANELEFRVGCRARRAERSYRY